MPLPRPLPRLVPALLLLLPALLLPGCEVLQAAAEQAQKANLQPVLPTVTYQGATLVQSPSQAQLQAYYCPRVVPDPLGVPGAAATLCAGFFGAPLPAQQLRVAFDLRFVVKNPNQFPIPVAELLTAATVFPQAGAQALGAACVQFCGKDQPGCTGTPGPQACTAKFGDIHTLQDFQAAAAGLLVASGVSLAVGQAPTFQMPEVVQDGEVVVTARFTFGPEALLKVLEQLAYQAVDQLKAGQSVQFVVPYQLQGTVWLDVGSLGRAAVGFGPAQGSWTVPTTALIP